ncbi:MAG: hypothetical protein ACTSRU_19425 [Candidatus Hodarchaeales archaeon]
MTYEITIQEQISVWQDLLVTIETDDDKETIMKNLKNGTFDKKYDFNDESVIDTFDETEDNIGYDYDNTTIDMIEEID